SAPGPTSLAPGAVQSYGVLYLRTNVGQADGSFHVATNDTAHADVVVTLTGSATPTQPPVATLVTPLLDFGSQTVGTVQTLQATIRNDGLGMMPVTTGAIDNPEFVLLSAAGTVNVAPGASRSYDIRYKRTLPGTANGVFHLATNDTTAPDVPVALTGVA